MYIGEIIKQLDSMSLKLENFTLVNATTSSMDPLDTAIIELRKRVVEQKKVMSDLTPPRIAQKTSIESLAKTKKKRTIILQRSITFGSVDKLTTHQNIINSYATLTGLVSGCVCSSVTSKNTVATISQIWSTSDLLQDHLVSSEFLEYQKQLSDMKLTENVVIQRIQAL